MSQKDGNKKFRDFVQRTVGLLILAGLHLATLFVELFLAIFKPRYRRVLGFHIIYFARVMSAELKRDRTTCVERPKKPCCR